MNAIYRQSSCLIVMARAQRNDIFMSNISANSEVIIVNRKIHETKPTLKKKVMK